MANGVKNYMWFPVLIALTYTIYTNDNYRGIAHKFLTGDLSGAYEDYNKLGQDVAEEEFEEKRGERLFTSDELRKFDNEENGLYLAILGRVYDVSEGKKYYGEGGTYYGFVGKDATLAFITGEFTEENLTDDVSSLSNSQAKSIKGWINFYDEKYPYKGKLIGRFYDKNGEPTAEYHDFENKVERAEEAASVEEASKQKFPPCNVEWKPEEGTRVWCSKQSGGITREWVGVPRQFFEEPTNHQNRCACVNLKTNDYKENQGKFREYTNCKKDSVSCHIAT